MHYVPDAPDSAYAKHKTRGILAGMPRVLAPALAALVLCGAAPAAATIDKGRNEPPATLTPSLKAIWETEWVACDRLSMAAESKLLHIPIKAGMTPQQAAKRLGNRAVYLLYNTQEETGAGADGCRNAILWRYYNPSAPRTRPR
jgi:hypothetical protein